MVWLAFLLLTMIISFKNKGLKRFVKYLDVFFFIFHIAMWIWLLVILFKDELYDKCSTPVNLFGFVYLILGLIALILVVFLILGFCFGKLTPKQSIGTGLDRGIYDTGDDVDFNPYQ